jgi:deoxyribonuclease V
VSGTWWPTSAAALEALQRWLAERAMAEPPWQPPLGRTLEVGGVFVATPRGTVGSGEAGQAAHAMGEAGQIAHAAAVVLDADGRLIRSALLADHLDAPYAPGLLALREGRLLQAVVERLAAPPDVLLVDATGRDHPRRAGLAIHLGAACSLPTIGITDRPLLASGPPPPAIRGAAAELCLDGELVGYRLRTHGAARAVVVHGGWRVDAETARAMVLRLRGPGRTPAPLRAARHLARTSRARMHRSD